MATKKNHYYVLVFAENGPAYVTSVNYADRTARWEKDKAPVELSKANAESLVIGLLCNFDNAVVVASPIELERQPYNYAYYDCQFVEKA